MPSKSENTKQNDAAARKHHAAQAPRQELVTAQEEVAPLTLNAQRAIVNPDLARPTDVPGLQRSAGNKAVTGLIQAKLMVGPAGDKHEQEADSVADQVMNMQSPSSRPRSTGGGVQRQEVEEEEVQTKPLAATLTPLVQRQDLEEEELQMKPLVQRQEEEELQMKRPVQRQEEEELQMKPLVQRQEEEELQMKLLAQRQDLEEEELQTKTDTRAVGLEGGRVPPDVVANIDRARGGGQPLDGAVQKQMSGSLGHDFSTVRVHADAEADALNEQLSARAFTTGQDIFFRKGEYNPSSEGGQELIAHELSHVVQQSTGRASGGGSGMTVRPAGDAFEQEADAQARQVAGAGYGAGVQAVASGIQRETDNADSAEGKASQHPGNKIKREDEKRNSVKGIGGQESKLKDVNSVGNVEHGVVQKDNDHLLKSGDDMRAARLGLYGKTKAQVKKIIKERYSSFSKTDTFWASDDYMRFYEGLSESNNTYLSKHGIPTYQSIHDKAQDQRNFEAWDEVTKFLVASYSWNKGSRARDSHWQSTPGYLALLNRVAPERAYAREAGIWAEQMVNEQQEEDVRNFLKRLMAVLHRYLKVQKPEGGLEQWVHPTAVALSHGGRVTIILPPGGKGMVNLILGDLVKQRRWAGSTHLIKVTRQGPKEKKVKSSSSVLFPWSKARRKYKEFHRSIDIKGKAPYREAKHGSADIYIGLRYPTETESGALLIGVETAPPGKGKVLGGRHGASGKASEFSSVGGVKKASPASKVGGMVVDLSGTSIESLRSQLDRAMQSDNEEFIRSLATEAPANPEERVVIRM